MEFHMPYSNDQSLFDRTLIFLKFSFSATMVALKERYDLVFCTSTPLTIALPGIFPSGFEENLLFLKLETFGLNCLKP